MRTQTLISRAFRPELREQEELPAGVCGRMAGVAVTYGVVDAYETVFKAGCMDRTKREKVPAGKVRLYLDHMAGVRSHVGVVRSLETAGGGEVMVADLFDTEEGRKAKEYLAAVLAAGAETGLSIGFYSREAGPVTMNGQDVYEFREIELDEISITPRPAVPGASVTDVRSEMGAATASEIMRQTLHILDETTVRALVAARFGDAGQAADEAPAPDTRSEGRTPDLASMDERLAALRRTY